MTNEEEQFKDLFAHRQKQLTEQEKNQCKKDGIQAYKTGLDINKCPYDKYDYRYYAWIAGYEKAMWEF